MLDIYFLLEYGHTHHVHLTTNPNGKRKHTYKDVYYSENYASIM